MILICKRVENEVLSGFQGYKWVKNEAWHDFKDHTTKVWIYK